MRLRRGVWIAGLAVGVGLAAGWWARGLLSGHHAMDHGSMAAGADGPCPGGAAPRYWRAPMDPTYVRDEPGKSPMGMDLVPECPGEGQGEDAAAGAVVVDAATVQNIGVRSVAVTRRDLARSVRAVGRVAYDERRVAHVHTKVQGWVEDLHVDFVGQEVERGQPLLAIYSPELVVTQEELLLAVRYREATGESPFEDVRSGGASLLAAAKRRLALWDIPERDIERLVRTGEVQRTLTLYAPSSGVVTELGVRSGMEVTPNANLYTIADLARVWVLADVYEYELPWLAVGQQATVELSYLPGEAIRGRLTYIAPFLDPATRTAEVRLELDNAAGRLKPEMFGNAVIAGAPLAGVLAIPAEAVIRSGRRTIAIVSLGEGRFEPREVALGLDTGDGWLEVRDGLREGEQVVVSSQFLIDSESNLQEAARKLLAAERGETGIPPADPAAAPGDAAARGAATPPAPEHRHGDPPRTGGPDGAEEPEGEGGPPPGSSSPPPPPGAGGSGLAAVLRRVIERSAENPFAVALAVAGFAAWGLYALTKTPLDAIPDLSDVQVIVFTEFSGQAPQVVEDQVTYPLSTAMLAVPRAEVVRGYSFFGFSFVYVIFADGTDLYWARSRVLEALNFAAGRLPPGVAPTLGPDATGVGWIYEYALVDHSGRHDLAALRSLQDWHLRYELQTVPGVAEVASVGGHVRQYQIEVDPNQLAAYGLSLAEIRRAIQRSNSDIGGKLVERAETEFMIRGRGYVSSTRDLEQVAIGASPSGTPILLRNVAVVSLGPELRRGITDLDGQGEVAAGVVIMRYGENALATLRRVKAKLAELAASLPPGVEIVPVYDRAPLIERAVANLRQKLLEQVSIVGLVCLVFLLHLRSALVAILLLPLGILGSIIAMYHQGINANIMSLGGIAIAIGTMVDAGIVMVENAHRHLERDGGRRPRREVLIGAAVEVGPSLFFSLLIIAVSFLPVLALQAQEGRLFRPLALTKTYAMAGAAVLSVTVVPALMVWLVRGRIPPQGRNPLSRALRRVYRPLLGAALRRRWLVLAVALGGLLASAVPLQRLGSEFMPPLDEGDLLYMPTTLPGLSITKARELLQQTDRVIATVPEVERVFGKVGRAETATDPAPLSMLETTITLKPRSEWRPGMTPQRLVEELDRMIRFPGLTNAWTMPIKTRIDMLSTGIKTPVGIKISGPELAVLEQLGEQIEAVLRPVTGTLSVYAERVVGGNYLDVDIDRAQIARYGLTVGDVQDVIQTAIGGVDVTETVEGLERYPVNLRYSRELRDDIAGLRRVLVATPSGAQVPLGQLAALRFAKGPPAIKSENARPNAWVYVDLEGIDVGTYVRNAREAVSSRVRLPPGYSLTWSGRYEYLERAQLRFALIAPLTLGAIFLLLYANFRRLGDALIVIAALPFALVGGVFWVWWLGQNLSVAVGAGFLALAGLAAETGAIMLLFLHRARDRALEAGSLRTRGDLWEATVAGAADRARPLLMTVASDVLGLLPIMWGAGTGSETMRCIAAPMVGGVVTATLVTLFVVPILFVMTYARGLPPQRRAPGAPGGDGRRDALTRPGGGERGLPRRLRNPASPCRRHGSWAVDPGPRAAGRDSALSAAAAPSGRGASPACSRRGGAPTGGASSRTPGLRRSSDRRPRSGGCIRRRGGFAGPGGREASADGRARAGLRNAGSAPPRSRAG